MAHWVNIQYQKQHYVIDLDFVNTFCYEKNGRVTFWLPNSNIPIIINPQSNWQDYQKITTYLECIQGLNLENHYWITLEYDRNQYIINLGCIHSFCQEDNGRLTFWLPNINTPIIVHPSSNKEGYDKILYYLQQKTGFHIQ